ncbi:Uncharacterized conserved protein YidB, DUF937 family [Acidiphilium rubrum]|uniref:Uncharacterized conserved protein YidB, DUF937 family n=2 Tax=Acidocellaceae TaxID=3385905 RepID=A0A8G2FH85_ACIRU|nr:MULTISPECIES: YidB family protein [Acidiphilium]SIR10362.1 Uncharacterized conserved protein YidB, DUF937 family [Acidiphilium rubrum]
MGLFDQISGMVSSALGGGDAPAGDAPGGDVQAQVMSVLQQHGIDGMSGVMQQFEQSGMGAHVASWIGNGQNLPISADQVQQALGNPVIASIAERFGIDPTTAANLLAQHLPAAVDQATPDAS